MRRLPPANYTVLSWLMQHLSRVAENSEVNKMTMSNLGVVFSPCLDMAPMLFKCFITDVGKGERTAASGGGGGGGGGGGLDARPR